LGGVPGWEAFPAARRVCGRLLSRHDRWWWRTMAWWPPVADRYEPFDAGIAE